MTMKAKLVFVKNYAKFPAVNEQVNPALITRTARATINYEEQIIHGWLINMSDGYRLLVTEDDKKRLVE